MKKIVLLLIAALTFGLLTNTQAQTRVKATTKKAVETAKKAAPDVKTNPDGWKKGGEGMINLSNVNFSQWAEGGVNTITAVGNLNLFADYLAGKWLWENDGRFSLGFSRTKNDGFIKGGDIIDIDSKLGYKLSEKAFWSNLLTFDSQFLEGVFLSDDKIRFTGTDPVTINPGDPIPDVISIGKDSLGRSKFLAPAVITFGTGIDYKPLDWVSIYFSPVTFKGIIINDDVIANAGTHGNVAAVYDETTGALVTAGKKFKPELGAKFVLGAKRNITESLSAYTNLDLFSNFLENKFGESKPQNIDVIWVTGVGLKLSKYIAANFEYTLKYDDEVGVPKSLTDADDSPTYQGKGAQHKTFFGIGFTYKF